MFSKLPENYSRAAEEKQTLSAALIYVFLAHRNLLEGCSGHFKILLESVKRDFDEISNKYYDFNIFSLNCGENGNYNSSSKNHLES